MKTPLFLITFFFSWMTGFSQEEKMPDTSYIQIALLLDVSGSMEGLVSQAQSQIWSIYNFVKTFHRDTNYIQTELAVLTYGNAGFDERHFINPIVNFTHQIDSIADKLFLVQTGGGSEFCSAAIQYALDSLAWKTDTNSYKTIFIAGNEDFHQGPVTFDIAYAKAQARQVLINTIYCGIKEMGTSQGWEAAAQQGGGTYTNIDHNQDSDLFQTPYDSKIVKQYQEYRTTFSGTTETPTYEYQSRFILNGGDISPAYRDMLIYQFRHNQGEPDIVDQFEHNNWRLNDSIKARIPAAWKAFTPSELQRQLFRIAQKRQIIREALQLYIDKVEEYLLIKVGPTLKENTLDLAMQQVIEAQLEKAGFKKQ